ncbi:MAG: hypothetical protein IZT56_00900 [Bacteroidetes bacterium]|nr:hypothetical protein [Bacteroidota bacterium]
MRKLKTIIINNLKGKRILFLFLLTNIVYAFMLTISIPKVMSFSNGLKLLDMMPTGYDSGYVNKLFEALGDNGRTVYLYHQIPIDMIYPFLFGISYCLILAYFLKKLDKLKGAFFYLCLLPLVAGIFDYFENFGIIKMLTDYPNYSLNLIKITNSFTVIKSIATTVYFLVLIIILILLGIKVLASKEKVVE